MKSLDAIIFSAIIAMLVALTACSGPDKSVPPAAESDSVETVMEQPDTVLFWIVDDYKKTKSPVFKDSIEITAPESVVNGINSIYNDIHLKFERRSNDTVYASIDSSFTFSNDMGTAGAAEYLSTVVINLTTLKNVNFVNLQFPVGSHATPGVFSKQSFEKYVVQEQAPAANP